MQSSPQDPGVIGGLGWIDLTALAVVVVFAVLGLFRGFAWQLSRILTLAAAYVAAGAWGDSVAARMDSWFPANADPLLPLYIAYLGIFLVVLVVVSIAAHFLEKLLQSDGFTLYNRLGGGVLGVVTGGCLVLALLAIVVMFFASGSPVVEAAQRSRSMAASKAALGLLGDAVPQPVREAFGLEPAAAPPAPGAPPTGSKPPARR